MSIILGIDPWTTTVWYGIIERKWNDFSLLDYGIIETKPKLELSKKLWEIGYDMQELIKKT